MGCPQLSTPCAWVQRVSTYARHVRPGHYVFALAAVAPDRKGTLPALKLHRVAGVTSVLKAGMYNPYTLTGNMIVNGAAVSAHSSWIFDSWMPTSLTASLPAIYQALFFPGRVLYLIGGSAAANALDVNNPQSHPETYGLGPH